MKKSKALIFIGIPFVLFAIGTIILLWMAYKDIHSRIAFKFAIGYVILAFLLLLYIPFISILELRKLKWAEIKRILVKRMFSIQTSSRVRIDDTNVAYPTRFGKKATLRAIVQ